jgi:alpha-beta hydrolase superfamily lysophospholipase
MQGGVCLAELAYAILEHQTGDGYVWKYRKYAAIEEPRAIVVFIHGIQSHSGWYENSCTQLARAGFDVYFLDRRGSGMNQEARGDAPSFRRLLDDIAEFLAVLDRNVSRGNTVVKLPVFLAGISWGGKLAVALERRHPGLVDGLILLCPGFFAKVLPPLGQRLGIIFSRLFRPRKTFPIPLNEPDFFTATPHWQQFLRDDPLRLHQATARLLVESVRLDGYLRFCPKYVHVPVLFLLASEDRVIRNDWTRGYVEKFATPDKAIIEYAGAHHTLEFEPDPSAFIGDVRGWVERHLPSPPV